MMRINSSKMRSVIDNMLKIFLLWLFYMKLSDGRSSHFAIMTNCSESRDTPVTIGVRQELTLDLLQITDPKINPNKSQIKDYVYKYFIHNASATDYYLLQGVDKFDEKPFLKYKKNKSGNISQFVIPPNFGAGQYIIQVTGRLPNGSKKSPDSVWSYSRRNKEYKFLMCFVEIKIYPPVARLKGDHYIHVPPHQPIEIFDDGSYETNSGRNRSDTLYFSWDCKTLTKKHSSCREQALMEGQLLTIPGRFVEKGEKFFVTLTVTIKGLSNYPGFVSKIIHVETSTGTKVEHLEIRCTKNCLPVAKLSNFQSRTIARVDCSKKCQKIPDQYFKWTIQDKRHEPLEFDYEDSTVNGRYGRTIVILPYALHQGIFFLEVQLQSNESHGYDYIEMKFSSPPIIKSCVIIPNHGDTLHTNYKLNCEQEPQSERNIYELWIRNNETNDEKLIMHGKYPDFETERFKMPPTEGLQLLVRAKKPEHPFVQVEVKANVKSNLKGKNFTQASQELWDLYNLKSLNDSLTNRLADPDPEIWKKALHQLEVMIHEVDYIDTNDTNEQKFVKLFKRKAAEDILLVPVHDINENLKIGQTFIHLGDDIHSINGSDPEDAKFITTGCNEITTKFLTLSEKETVDNTKSKQIFKVFSKCANLNSHPDGKLIHSYQDLTTHKLNVDPGFEEVIPDYLDDDRVNKNLENLRNATRNRITILHKMAKLMCRFTKEGEQQEQEDYGDHSVVIKDVDVELTKKNTSFENFTMIFPQDFAKNETIFEIKMTAIKKNYFWWTKPRITIISSVIDLEFWFNCTKNIDTFESPFQMYFKLLESRKRDLTRFIMKIPANFNKIDSIEKNYYIRVHRVAIASQARFYLTFYNVTPADVFYAVLTTYKFPTIKDFQSKNYSIITAKNATMFLTNSEDRDIYLYLGILYKVEERNSAKSVPYRLRFTHRTCISWNMNWGHWDTTCISGHKSNLTHIHCYCYHTTVFTGYIQELPSIVQEIIKPNIVLKICRNYLVFNTVIITFCIFYLLILLKLVIKEETVYFLGDNNFKNRFAYLLIVTTGIGFKAGTSSNVVVQIHGDKRSSEPHVLNYPDPEKRFLQQFGHDMFLLTTEQHLGNVEKLELWMDSIGPEPAWYCKDIKVYDLQQRKEWYFKVKKTMSVIKNTTHIFVNEQKQHPPETEPSENPPRIRCLKLLKKKSSTKPKRFKLLHRYHTWYLWQKEEHFTYLKKLTVILSNILTTYSLALIFHGLPKFRLNDCFDNSHYFTIKDIAFFCSFVFFSSFPTFIVHFLIAWCFRLSKLQFSRYEQQDKLPFNYNFGCWILLIILIILSTSFLMIYGFWIPIQKSWIWLMICAVGISFGIVVYEGVFIFFEGFFWGKLIMVFNIWRKLKDILVTVESQRRHLYEKFGSELLRPYLGHMYSHLRPRKIRLKAVLLNRRYSAISEVLDLFMFGVYIIVLYFVILVDKDSLVIHAKDSLKAVIEGKHTRTLDFHDIYSVDDIYVYINETLIHAIHPTVWYENYYIRETALIADMTNKILGVARLRQHRIAGICRVPTKMQWMNLSCRPELSKKYESDATFGKGWSTNLTYSVFARLKHIWAYSERDETQTLATFGVFAIYSGGGYVAYLGRTLYNSWVNFLQFYANSWINDDTRVLFIEFLTYNADYNVFNAVKLVFERSASGFIVTTSNIFTTRMIFVQDEQERIAVTIFFFFAIWVAILTIKHTVGMFKEGRWKNAWIIIDTIILLLSIVCIVTFLVRANMVGNYLDAIRKARHNEFINYFYLFYIEDFLMIVAAILLCFATIRLWRFLRFAKVFRAFEVTLKIASVPLLSFTCIFHNMFFVSSMTLVMLAGNKYEDVHTLLKMSRVLLTMAFKPREMGLRNYTDKPLCVTYLSIYIIFLVVSLYIFIMIIVKSYLEAQLQISSEAVAFSTKDYLLERLAYFPRFLRYKVFRVRGGTTTVIHPKVVPKIDKIYYLNSFYVKDFKMVEMQSILQSCIRNKTVRKTGNLSDKDVELMTNICLIFLQTDKEQNEVEVFFKGQVQGKRLQFVFERKLEKMANVTNLMLQEEELAFHQRHDTRMTSYIPMVRQNDKTLKKCVLNLKMCMLKTKAVEMQLQQIL